MLKLLKLAYGKEKTLENTKSKLVNIAINRAVQNNNPLEKIFKIIFCKMKIKEAKKFE
jgi:hypothetical protein